MKLCQILCYLLRCHVGLYTMMEWRLLVKDNALWWISFSWHWHPLVFYKGKDLISRLHPTFSIKTCTNEASWPWWILSTIKCYNMMTYSIITLSYIFTLTRSILGWGWHIWEGISSLCGCQKKDIILGQAWIILSYWSLKVNSHSTHCFNIETWWIAFQGNITC